MSRHLLSDKLCSPASWNDLADLEERFDVAVQAVTVDQIALRCHLHAHPEPSGEEVATSKYIFEQLQQLGLKPKLYRDGLGVSVDFEIGHPDENAPFLAVRADIDALRMQDEKEVPYKSQCAGLTHACGHDAHTAVVLGLAMAGQQYNNRLPTGEQGGLKLRLIFQPAEESCEGAGWMVEQRVLDDIDAILGLHVAPEYRCGQVGIRYGVLTANCDEVDISITGHGGHAARLHHTVDPVAISALLMNALYQHLPRAVDSRNPAVFSIGCIAGGYAANVIPEHVELKGTLRTVDDDVRRQLKQRIESICAGIAEAGEAQISVDFTRPLGSVFNHTRVASALECASRRLLGTENINIIDAPSMGGEDFSVYTAQIPGAQLRLGCAQQQEGDAPFLHSPLFDIDEQTLSIGTRILYRAALLLAFEHSR